MGIIKKSGFIISATMLGLGVSCNLPNQTPSKTSHSLTHSLSRFP